MVPWTGVSKSNALVLVFQFFFFFKTARFYILHSLCQIYMRPAFKIQMNTQSRSLFFSFLFLFIYFFFFEWPFTKVNAVS